MQITKFYPEVASNPDFAAMEQEILNFWQKERIFEQSVAIKSENNAYVFYDGPPFANGLPHYGHLLTGFIKDTVARYQTMKGKQVGRRFGWDCHGLPAEMGAEKELSISGRMQIIEYGVDKFNEQCRKSVLKYTAEWEQYVTRQARWVDFKNDYKTMDITYMESVLWAFKQLYNKGLIYESMRVMPYSWACETPLSNFETRLDNSYRERADKAVTFGFTLKTPPPSAPANCKSYKLLAWTTMAWTVIPNLAIAVGRDIDYAAIVRDGECLILAKSALKKYSKELGLAESDYSNVVTLKGEELLGLHYEPIYNYFAAQPNAFVVLPGSFVTDSDGTAIVSIAPGFGEDDQMLCKEYNIELVCPVDAAGKFTPDIQEFAGQQVFDTIDEVIKYLKNIGSWIRTEQYIHNYPHCWRTDTPLIYKAVPSWYVEVTKFRDKMVKNNQQINWIPFHVRDGLFGKWLENAKDWSISRNRFWGTPIPVWKSDDPRYPRIDVYGSIEELENDFGVKITDLHKPFIDDLVRANPDDPSGKSMMRRVTDVFDCWFESGSMPYAQVHYPFEHKEWFEHHFPADFIVEYVAQTRGWFYTLMVLSTALFDRPPFLNCICHGVILDEKGQKLSKRLNNYADPMELFAQYGADALRFVMLSSPVMRGQELLIDKNGRMVRDALRLSIKPIWNVYNFFTLYANADGIKASFDLTSDNLLDQYILAKLREVVLKMESSLDLYDTVTACTQVNNFFEILTNWYIRRNRQRFWKKEHDHDKQTAYNTLYSLQIIMCRAFAPLLPLLAEEIYLGLAGGVREANKSVHIADFPDVSNIQPQEELVAAMDKVQEICSAVLAIRNNQNIKTRTPLRELQIRGRNVMHLQSFAELIKDEVNVKQIQFAESIGEEATLKLQLNFSVLGKRLPNRMKDILSAVKTGNWQLQGHSVEVLGEKLMEEEYEIILEPKHKTNSQALPTNDALVILDLTITEELRREGLARDLVRIIQQARKDTQLDIADRIILSFTMDEGLRDALRPYVDYIQEQTLSEIKDTRVESSNYTYIKEEELGDKPIVIGFSKVNS